MKRGNKYGAVKVTVDGIRFDSKREAAYYGELKLRERAGEVGSIRCHEEYPLKSNGVFIGKFKPDFMFFDRRTNHIRVVDIKSPPTAKKADFRLRKKLFEAQYGIELEIVF